MYVLGIDETAADDAICDGQNDKGIDAIFVDDDNEDIVSYNLRSRKKLNQKLVTNLYENFMEATPI